MRESDSYQIELNANNNFKEIKDEHLWFQAVQ